MNGLPSREEAWPPGYSAATRSAAWMQRPSRQFVILQGRSPARMLLGLSSGRIPSDPLSLGPGLRRGIVPYSTLLTPKGRLVADMRVSRIDPGDAGSLLLDLPTEAFEEALTHLQRFLPPRLARVMTPEVSLRMLTLIGPEAASLLASLASHATDGSNSPIPGSSIDRDILESFSEGEELTGPGASIHGFRLIRIDDVRPQAWDVIMPEADLDAWSARLAAAGVSEADPLVWDTLRVERGRPEFGHELDHETLPPEAGIEDRAIDPRKGCYTGQEVIVRIRDRGKVNRRLRGLLLGPVPPPRSGTLLYAPGREQPVGETRTSVHSPRFGQTAALGYVRREIDPPALLHLGDSGGPCVQVRAIASGDWVLVDGDRPEVS